MKLTKVDKKILDYANNNEAKLGFYFVTDVAPKVGLSIDTVQKACENMASKGIIMWGDKQHTGFRPTAGAQYKEYQRLDQKEVWANRLWGFAFGVLTGFCIAYFTKLFGLI